MQLQQEQGWPWMYLYSRNGAHLGHGTIGGFSCGALTLPKLSLSLLSMRPRSFRSIPLNLETLSEVLHGTQVSAFSIARN